MLRGQSIEWKNEIFYEFEDSRMIRTADWKYTRRFPDGPDELYHLVHDPGERQNLAGNPDFSASEAQMRERLASFFDRYVDPQYDLWHDGRSKAGPVVIGGVKRPAASGPRQ
ncbi:MAG: hypothetical protein KJZ87_19630 [Thermoguttaceae bacterium]|nr:hypothetical protein [Thermoguttaceae bacterium]